MDLGAGWSREPLKAATADSLTTTRIPYGGSAGSDPDRLVRERSRQYRHGVCPYASGDQAVETSRGGHRL